jgi:YfiH family protein
MFWSRQVERGRAGTVEIVFTDRHGGVSAAPCDSLDLGGAGASARDDVAANFAALAEALGVDGFATMSQAHGRDVVVADSIGPQRPSCDALVSSMPWVALCVRVADCVPVVLADPDSGVTGVAHAGRKGVAAGVINATIDAMEAAGAEQIRAWVGPHVCGGCYEVPAELRAEVSEVVPAAFACTTWGTPSIDLGAAVRSQLEDRHVTAVDVEGCTRESADLYSYRRDHQASGRFAGIVVLKDHSRG